MRKEGIGRKRERKEGRGNKKNVRKIKILGEMESERRKGKEEIGKNRKEGREINRKDVKERKRKEKQERNKIK